MLMTLKHYNSSFNGGVYSTITSHKKKTFMESGNTYFLFKVRIVGPKKSYAMESIISSHTVFFTYKVLK